MSKAIRSYSSEDRSKVIARRIKGKTMGLGYWSAVDAARKQGVKVEVNKEVVTDSNENEDEE